MKFLVTLSKYHDSNPKLQHNWGYYGAIIQIIDWDKKKIIKEIEYESPPENIGGTAQLMFSGAQLFDNKLYIVTKTEILVYSVDSWELEQTISFPFFNDLHSVIRVDNELILANTGMETVQYFDLEGNFLREVNMAYTHTAKRFHPDVDYRLFKDTKPHEVHINQVFLCNGEVWVTRLIPQDAVVINNPYKKILIKSGQPHDGSVIGNDVAFTTTNGHIVIADWRSGKVIKDIDINKLHKGNEPLGWCRGIEIIGDQAFVGFTKLRETKQKGFKFWKADRETKYLPSRILQVDLERESIEDTYEIEKYSGAAIYSICKF